MTDVTLREHIERILMERDRALEIRFDAARDALVLAAQSLQEKDHKIANIEMRLEKIERASGVTEGRGSILAMAGVITVVLNLLFHWWPK